VPGARNVPSDARLCGHAIAVAKAGRRNYQSSIKNGVHIEVCNATRHCGPEQRRAGYCSSPDVGARIAAQREAMKQLSFLDGV
jgi:hypothetical protein